MKACCCLCKKKIDHGEDYTSINKGNYSEEGDKDWIVLIFHDVCWENLGKEATGKIVTLFQAEA